MAWYNTLNKPIITPPAGVFAPVWVILYILMGLSFYFFISKGFSKGKIFPTILFAIQLLLNIIWSPIFFALQNIGLALIIVILMWFSILLTIFTFYKYSKLASLLLIPYFLWVTFAVYLNIGFWVLN